MKMQIPTLEELKADLQNALVINSEGLFLLAGGKLGGGLAANYLGVDDIQDLPSDLFTAESHFQMIDVSRHYIWTCIEKLHHTLDARIFAETPGAIEIEELEQEYLVFLELFLSSIPNVALGGWDGTSVRSGHLMTLFKLSSAWFRLGSDIHSALKGDWEERELQVSDLAILGGISERSIRNQIGKNKPIRSDDIEGKITRKPLEGRAFVAPNLFDALDWLQKRESFNINQLSHAFIMSRVESAPKKSDKARSLLIAWMVNNGTIKGLANQQTVSIDDLKAVSDGKANTRGTNAIKSAWNIP
jgi:hypothetical protein